MLTRIKSNVERELRKIGEEFSRPPLNAIPGKFGAAIDQFVQRKGKRLRAVLFVVGYKGFTDRQARNLYRSAASLELLHDFILIHDDLIDHASIRRGSPSMHACLDTLLDGKNGLRFKGSDLAIIIGDMMYAMAIQAFLSISEDPVRKQEALSILTETALFTGCGELDELLQTLRPLSEVDPKDIYRIYDWKTGHYSFTSPLTMGATLAGASRKDIRLFRQVGQDLGRAFQIRDDLLDLYGDGDRFGKPGLLDLQEGKKTLPVWYAYHNCPAKHKARMRVVLEQPGASKKQIREIAGIIDSSGAADYAEGEMEQLVKKSVERLRKTAMRPTYRDFLIDYVSKMLTPPART